MSGYENPLKTRFKEEFFRSLPNSPGVYFMFDGRGSVLYIGKAKCLRKRVSTYRNLHPGRAPEHILQMIKSVERIKWEECETEASAFMREAELIHAVRPHFNIAANWPADYLFIGLRLDKKGRLHLRLTSQDREEGYRLYGCYKHRYKTKRAYCALLRLIHAATYCAARFSFPAKITRTVPAYNYATAFRAEWAPPLRLFLSGKSRRFLHALTLALLENENLPPFVYPGLQKDLHTLAQFYRHGPRASRKLGREHGLKTSLIAQDQMDAFIARRLVTPYEQ